MYEKLEMNMITKLCCQAGFGFVAGGATGYWFGREFPAETPSEMIQTIASISAISGSLVGWSSNWIAQSRSIIRDIDHNIADDLFHQLGDFQKELIWRWAILFFSSIFSIAFAGLAEASEWKKTIFSIIFPVLAETPKWNKTIFSIAFARLAETPNGNKIWPLTFSFGFLGITVIFVFFLFRGMTAVVGLKNKLDDYERNELRKERLLRKTKKEETMD